MLEDGKKIMLYRYENAEIFCNLVGAKYKKKTAVQRHLDKFFNGLSYKKCKKVQIDKAVKNNCTHLL